MLPYFLILIFVIFIIVFEKYAVNRKAFLFPFLSLVLFASIRSDEVGADTKNYTLNFNNNFLIDNYSFNDGIELGYKFLEYFILYFTNNYFWLFFISSCIVIFCYLYIFKKFSVNYFISVFTFISFGYYTFFFNGLRQGIAMALSALSLPYLINNNFFKYFLVIFIASFFHKSALILILFYFLVNMRFKFEYKLILILFTSLILSPLVISILSSHYERYSSYSSASENSGGYLTLIFYLLIGLIGYFSLFLSEKDNVTFNKIFQLYFLGVIFIIPIAMIGTSASGPQRLLFYFSWLSCFIIPYFFDKIRGNFAYFTFFALCFIYFYLITTRFSLLVPYSINSVFRIF
ncbi:EpsG family protein [Acinetobacter sp. YWS30-1]|uniref:EpsG family protein n=1 Tax=Acinetobacter sp. YWS30-1 TaxID=2996862 RepID=UPI002B263E5D|nr:EpsG family protein [Acinetobacter sp. YWS30-1]WPC34790.1 EpsG family protein [Acinetobacter sp. YWS30-1]